MSSMSCSCCSPSTIRLSPPLNLVNIEAFDPTVSSFTNNDTGYSSSANHAPAFKDFDTLLKLLSERFAGGHSPHKHLTAMAMDVFTAMAMDV
mgnify:FL=1